MYVTKEIVQAHITCPRLAHARFHEPHLAEFRTPEALDRMAEGASVGRAAQAEYSAGILIPTGGRWEVRLAATQDAINSDIPVIFEGAFEAPGNLRAVVDILEVSGGALHLTEVKSGTAIEKGHLCDVAFQVLVIRALGYHVTGASVMHLNPCFRAGVVSEPLFSAEDVWADVVDVLPELPAHVDALSSLASDPNAPPSRYRTSCKECPLKARCEPPDADHIRTLYYIREQEASKFEEQGVTRIRQIPAIWKTSSKVRRRQVDAVRSSQVLIDHEQLRLDLTRLRGKAIGHIDFETTQSAIPVYPRASPWQQMPVQWSCHMEVGGEVTHTEWLARGPDDPREQFASTLIAATRGAEVLTVWNEKFERSVLGELAEYLPHYRAELLSMSDKIVDLLKVVRGSMYHPSFHGSFSLKKVLPALVPSLSYGGLSVQNGAVAAVALKRLLRGDLPDEEAVELRRDLLAYCELDTWAEVALLRRLFQEVAA